MLIYRIRRIVTVACLMLTLTATAAAAASDWDYWNSRKHSIFTTVGFGPTTVRPEGNEREVEGITFQFATEDTGLGGAGMFGYWITDNVGLEFGYWDFGAVDVPFSFQDPHDNTSGTGESAMHFTGYCPALLLGYDIGAFQIFGRLGAIIWSQDMSTRFDIPDEPAIRRQLSKSGTDVTYGVGASWRFHTYWSLQVQYERTVFNKDKVDLFLLGLSYDFLGVMKH